MIYISSPKPILKTLQDATLYFADPKHCIDYVVRERWPDGVVICPNCGGTGITFLPTRQLFQCKNRHPKRQFSVKVGTIFGDSPLPLGKWLLIMWMLVNCRNGISSYEVARTIGITQKSAWFMLHRLRESMKDDDSTLSGEVEADETYYGGKIKNKHRFARRQGKYKDKTPIFGMVERGGRVMAMVPKSATAKEILPVIADRVEPKSTIVTDAHTVYDNVRWMGRSFNHLTINHQQDAFRRGRAYTNTIENFWSCLKRTLHGTYIAVRPDHLLAYVIEQVFRYNHRRHFSEEQRFANVLRGVSGKRLTYVALIARSA